MPKMRNGGVTMTVIASRVSTLRDGGWTVVGKDEPAEVVEPAIVEPDEVVDEPTNAEIHATAEAEGIDLGGATSKTDMLAAIDAHYAAHE